jgi:hypothetical protein
VQHERLKPERLWRSGPLCAEAGTGRAVLSPAPLSSLAALFLRCAPDKFSLAKPNTSCTIEMPASLCSDGVRVHPGMPFGFPPETAFGFAGILRSMAFEKMAVTIERYRQKPSLSLTRPQLAALLVGVNVESRF